MRSAAVMLFFFFFLQHAGAVLPDKAGLCSFLPMDSVMRQERSRGGVELSPGKFLVASRRIGDPRFKETVILLIQHDGQGTVGLIINRPTKLRISDVFAEIKERAGEEHHVFIGGPVGMDRMQMLIQFRSKPSKSGKIFDNVYVSSSKALLNSLTKGNKTGDLFRLYAGYAGWLPGQLEREILRGDWSVIPADAEYIFNKEPAQIWPDLIREREVIRIKL